MWDYENGTMEPEKRKRDSDTSQRQSVDPQMLRSSNCELCGGSQNGTDCPHESRFSQAKIHTCLI